MYFLPQDRYNKFTEEEKKEYIDYNKIMYKKWTSANLIQFRLLAAKHRAKRKGLVFDITTEDIESKLIEQEYRCYFSGLPLEINLTKGDEERLSKNSISIDRLNSTKGYTKDNIVITATVVNLMKSDYSESEFLEIINLIYNHRK